MVTDESVFVYLIQRTIFVHAKGVLQGRPCILKHDVQFCSPGSLTEHHVYRGVKKIEAEPCLLNQIVSTFLACMKAQIICSMRNFYHSSGTRECSGVRHDIQIIPKK